MKAIEKLIEAANAGITKKTLGNHSFNRNNKEIRFAYHGNVVCYWNLETNTFKLDGCGWKGYPSTTRTLNSYKNLLTGEYGAHEEA